LGSTYRGVESNKLKKTLQLNFTQVTTSFDMGTLKISQFLQNKSPPCCKLEEQRSMASLV